MSYKGKHYIVGVHITNRVKHVPSVQNVLTEFGCNIKTRIGLHEMSEDTCSPNGLILVELIGDDQKLKDFTSALKNIEGVEVKEMIFSHD
ncbi:MAG TPA: hypothetical protein VHP36_09475 [Chitinispirillaceae bacterium]|nr:hypothetical protein [Chitinispirillaceae bacterium]